MGQNAKRNTIHVWNTGQLSTDTDPIPALPPPMPSLSQLVPSDEEVRSSKAYF